MHHVRGINYFRFGGRKSSNRTLDDSAEGQIVGSFPLAMR